MTSDTRAAPSAGVPARRARLTDRIGALPRPVRRALANPVLEGLATPHGVTRYLEAVHPLWSLEGGRALVTDVRAETPAMTTLTLRPDHAWRGFSAGQHVRLGVDIDGARHTRTYSVSCSQHRRDGQLTITVKRKEGGLVSGHLTDEEHPGRVTFLHYARTRDDVAFADDLERIDALLPGAEVVVVPTASRRTGHVTGRFDPAHLDALVPDHREIPTFACGPSGLVDAVEQHYEDAGARHHLQVERFSPPALRQHTGPGEGTVRFAASDLEIDDDGRPLLDQAEDAGLEPEFGCRMGICRTCTRGKVAGGIVDLRTGRRSDAPEEPIQICVSVAAGDVVLDL